MVRNWNPGENTRTALRAGQCVAGVLAKPRPGDVQTKAVGREKSVSSQNAAFPLLPDSLAFPLGGGGGSGNCRHRREAGEASLRAQRLDQRLN